MKKISILSLIFFVFLTHSKSQTIDTCFSKNEVVDIANTIYELKQKDSLNIRLINSYELKIDLLNNIHQRDSIIISLYDKRIDIKEDEIKFYKESYEYYKKRNKLMFIGGFASVMVSSLVLHWALN
jgi:hypothetical protein